MELPSYFTKYLREIQPSRTSRERAIQLHTTLRDRLSSTDDEYFADWFSGSFLYGSYIRNTAIHPIKDVDVCLLLNLSTSDYTPETIVRRLKNLLEDLGYEDKTAYQRRSIRIDMSGTTMDAVPVVPNDEAKPLSIPDRKLKEWVDTHPKAHIEATTRINKECGGRYIPLVKIVKAWYRYQAKEKRVIERPKPKGFTLEVLVAKYQDQDAPTYAEAFVSFLQNLMNACGVLLKSGIFPQIPDPGLPNEYLKVNFEPDEAKLFAAIVEESLAIAKKAIVAETYGESAKLWRDVFGNQFPDAPASVKSLRFSETIEEAEAIFDPLIEAEISEIELPLLPDPTARVRIKAELAYKSDSVPYQHYPTGSRAVPKGTWIRFSVADTTVSPPYTIKWTVENHGKEARDAGDMGHSYVKNSQDRFLLEHTKYRGTHYMICEIIKYSVVVARTKHIVNIK
jgi:hypothetical protein